MASREIFWNINLIWLFYSLTTFAVIIFISGCTRNIYIWSKGWAGKTRADFPNILSAVLKYILGNTKIFRGDIFGGLMHIFIMWGFFVLFLGTVLSAFDEYIYHFLRGLIYKCYALILDTAGLLFILGLLMAAIRRYILKSDKMYSISNDLFILILLMAIGLTGFLIEGFRILAKPQVWANWEPVGAFIALWPAGNPTLFHSLFWWIHICLSLFFIAYLPFSKLFHIITGIVNVVLEMSPPDILTLEEREKSAKDFSLKHFIAFDACTRCNRCENKCPSNQSGEALSPREINQKMRDYFRNQFSFISIIKKLLKKTVPEIPIKKAIQGEEPWMCTTCRACIEECPLIINNPDIIRQIRMLKIEEGTQVPVMIGETLESIFKHGNPFQGQKSKRTEWAQGLEVKSLSDKETSEFLYFVGCAPSYDERLQAIAQNTVKIFNKFKMDFSVLGNKESCCGDMAKRLGEDGLLEELIMKNYETFERFKVNRIITACPHGLKMLRDEYPLYKKRLGIENNIKLDVQHYTQLLATHIKEGTIKFRKAFNRRVTYHDPCYLGRHCDIYNPPRDIIKAIPEIEFFEMERNRSNSFCCGGGGGRFMMEEFEAREKISELRVKEAAKIDAQILITACPFCLSMLEDALKTAGYEDKIEVKDISELMVELI